MAEYINKEDAMEQSCYACDGYPCPFPCPSYRALDNMPTIDIVRCKDCKHMGLHKLYQEVLIDNWCEIHGKIASPYWFCADGERRPALKHADKETLQSAT